MKKSIKIIGALAILFCSVWACKKGEQIEDVDSKNQKFSVAMQVSVKGVLEKAILVGTKAELETALNSKEGFVYLKKIAKSNNVFVPIAGAAAAPVDPVDENKLCLDEVKEYIDANMAEWIATANETCQPVYPPCYTCPYNGMSVLIETVKPTSLKCTPFEEAVKPKFTIYSFGEDELESAALARYIKNK